MGRCIGLASLDRADECVRPYTNLWWLEFADEGVRATLGDIESGLEEGFYAA
jgi:hypothetical protein